MAYLNLKRRIETKEHVAGHLGRRKRGNLKRRIETDCVVFGLTFLILLTESQEKD